MKHINGIDSKTANQLKGINTKELSDEEILKVYKNNPFIDGYLNKNLIEFAKAILQKASEK